MNPGVGADLGQRVLQVGVDAQEDHALLLELGGQVLQPRGIALGQRAFGAEEGHDDQLVLVVVQRVELAVEVGQREALDLLADRGAGGVGRQRERSATDNRPQPPQLSKIVPSSHLELFCRVRMEFRIRSP